MKNRLKLEKTVSVDEKMRELTIPESTYGLFGIADLHEPADDETVEVLTQNIQKSMSIHADMYPLPEMWTDKGNPRGSVRKIEMEDSVFYPGTKHTVWVYVPAAYREEEPADLAVFFDSQMYVKDADKNYYDYMPLCLLLDNMIAAGEIPPTIGVVASYGKPGPGQPFMGFREGHVNRSYEYDMTSDLNARFVIEELLPQALEGLSVSADPADHFICGLSSSAIASFAAGWFRNDFFGNVFQASPSFANIRNGIVWPSAIRIGEKKKLKVYTVSGRYDLDNNFGNWLLVDLQVGSALQFRGYDSRFYISQAGHSAEVLRYCMEAALAWLLGGKEPAEDGKLEKIDFGN